ncbi:MAG: hypothetical protein ACYC0X_12525 [Pirellulaceae bacterium]
MKAKINKWFTQRDEPLELIVQHSVGGNTFRAFQNMPKRPSEVFRDWALRKLRDKHTTRALFCVRSQAAYEKWHQDFCSSFRKEWQGKMKDRLPYGPSRKLPDLLLKAFARCSELPDDQRSRVTAFLHVSLDSRSLVGIRNCIDDPEIPANATMAFVAGPTMYRQIQEAIRAITKEAEVPAVYYDVLVWDIRR